MLYLLKKVLTLTTYIIIPDRRYYRYLVLTSKATSSAIHTVIQGNESLKRLFTHLFNDDKNKIVWVISSETEKVWTKKTLFFRMCNSYFKQS